MPCCKLGCHNAVYDDKACQRKNQQSPSLEGRIRLKIHKVTVLVRLFAVCGLVFVSLFAVFLNMLKLQAIPLADKKS